jgi:hypothetical protein
MVISYAVWHSLGVKYSAVQNCLLCRSRDSRALVAEPFELCGEGGGVVH